MRDFLDQILDFIGTSSLTTEEYELILLEDEEMENLERVYFELSKVLDARSEISTYRERLRFYFLAQGADISQAQATPPARSNILIGGGLCAD